MISMKLSDIPTDLPLDRVWVPVSDADSANTCLQLLHLAQQAVPRPAHSSDADQI